LSVLALALVKNQRIDVGHGQVALFVHGACVSACSRAFRAVEGEDGLRIFPPLLGAAAAACQSQRWIASSSSATCWLRSLRCGQLKVPTFVGLGAADPVFPLHWAYELRETIPSVAQVVELQVRGPSFPDERAGELVCHLGRHWHAHPAFKPAEELAVSGSP
jgi:pimeloyl-ACP methyl ester carboxylesterase